MKKSSSIVITGDIGFDRYMAGRWKDDDLLAPEVLSFLHSGDHVLANVEGAMIDESVAEDARGKGVLFHTMDPEAVRFLKLIRADIWNVANNHTLDAGLGGIKSTLEIAHAMGSRTIGAGKDVFEAEQPVILKEAGGIGFIGVGFLPECIRATETEAGSLGWDELDRIRKAIAKVKETCRWCVVISHSGEEFTTLPSEFTRDVYRKYLDFGADIVVGHHPHVPMNYELRNGKAIFYSLGNFVFDTDYQRTQIFTTEGILLKVHFTEDTFSFEPFPIHIVRDREVIEKGTLPAVFCDVSDEDYEKLYPTAVRAFLENEKKRMVYMWPQIYKNYTAEQWRKNFLSYEGDCPYRIKGWHHDLNYYVHVLDREDPKDFDTCTLESVKDYIRRQL